MAEGGSGSKTGDFFVGLVDFFAILLPGGLLAFLIYTSLRRWFPMPETSISIPEGWVGLVVVGLVSYLLGHLLSVIGSLCIDPLYDWWKKTYIVWDKNGWATNEMEKNRRSAMPATTAATPNVRDVIEQLATGMSDLLQRVRLWASPESPPHEGATIAQNARAGDSAPANKPNKPAKFPQVLWQSLKSLKDEEDKAGATTLQDAAVTLRVASSGAAAEMDHLEADQKFFRGLILVFLFAWLTFFWDWKVSNWFWTGAFLLLFPMFPFTIFPGAVRTWREWKESNATAQPEQTEEKRNKQLAILRLVTVIAMLVGWALWFRATPPMSVRPPSVSGSLTAENRALSVTASTGDLRVTANSNKNENSDVLWTLRTKYEANFRIVLIAALMLSVVRFVQQRLKYSKFVYRAYRIITTRPPQRPEH